VVLLPAGLHGGGGTVGGGALDAPERCREGTARRAEGLARRGRLLRLQRAARDGAVLDALGVRRLRAARRRDAPPGVRQRRPGPARRGALGAGVAAVRTGRGDRRLRVDHLPGSLCPLRREHARVGTAVPRRRGRDAGDRTRGGAARLRGRGVRAQGRRVLGALPGRGAPRLPVPGGPPR
jgi:hypothetical protein